MTNAASAHTGDFWDVDFAPTTDARHRPTQTTSLRSRVKRTADAASSARSRTRYGLGAWRSPWNWQCHAWATGQQRFRGLSTDQGFYLYGQVNLADLHRAVPLALQRLTRGEWDLAVHPRCGTNLSVGMVLTAGLALGAHLILPRGPIEQLLGLGLATAAATQLAPDLGILAQRYLTTAIPFNLAVEDIAPTADIWGRPVHFVQVRWRE